jgi:hypothetical protein
VRNRLYQLDDAEFTATPVVPLLSEIIEHISVVGSALCGKSPQTVHNACFAGESVRRQLFFPIVVPHLRIKLPGNCCLIQSQTIEGNDGRKNQHHPVSFLGRLVVTLMRNQICFS